MSGKSLCRMDFFRFWGGIFGGVYFQDPSCLVLLLLVHAWQQKMHRGQSPEKRASSLQALNHHRPWVIPEHGPVAKYCQALVFVCRASVRWDCVCRIVATLFQTPFATIVWKWPSIKLTVRPVPMLPSPPPSKAEFLLSLECAVPGAQFVSTRCSLRMSSSPRGRWRHVASPLFPFAVDFEWEARAKMPNPAFANEACCTGLDSSPNSWTILLGILCKPPKNVHIIYNDWACLCKHKSLQWVFLFWICLAHANHHYQHHCQRHWGCRCGVHPCSLNLCRRCPN